MDPSFVLLVLLGIFALIVLLITIGEWFEDIESDMGSQSNPNSQVQLAPQVGVLHRLFNKAISGEPVSQGLNGVIGATLFTILWWGLKWHPVLAIAIAAAITTLFHMSLATTAHVGRITSANVFGQPLYYDVIITQLPLIASHAFILTSALIAVSYLFYNVFFATITIGPGSSITLGQYLGYPIAIPLLGLLLGITAGAIGSSTGDVHYGAEREFQHAPYGEGVPMGLHGYITVKAEVGYRMSMDVAYFCAKYGGPLTGFTYGTIILLDNLRLFIGNVMNNVAMNVAIGATILVIIILFNRYLEKWARNKFGPYG
ncbi:MAG: tetrahydromethanopterin S-methyltransferase subunit E [Candidatus Nezhaarchaeales archaeon]